MRIPFTRLPSLVCLSGALVAVAATAQEPTPPPAPTPDAPATAPEAPDATPEPEAAPRPRRRPRRPAVVIEAGTIHPVAGPEITDGVLVIRGERIVAIGKRGEVELPENAVVRSFPTGHVYPGLVDAATDAFTDAALRNDGGLDAPDALADALQLRHDREDELVRAGITTAYIAVASQALLRGQGAIVRPTKGGFELWEKRERAGLELRLTSGPGPGHPLQRQQLYQSADNLFEGLDEFRKGRAAHDEALTKYQKEFDEYLTWHRNKNKKDGDKPTETKDAAKPAEPANGAEPPASPPQGPRRGRRGGPGGPPRDGAVEPDADPEQLAAAVQALFTPPAQDPPKQDPPKQDPPKQDAKPAGQEEAPKTAAAEKKDEGPKRPTYPKAPPANPQKEVLLRVIDGELPLRVEAHRADELRAALQLQDDRQIPVMVLERAYDAAGMAAQLADRGVAVVVTDVLPASLPEAYEDFDPCHLPARLQQAGVTFAIASGSGRRAALLPMMAATAIGNGLAATAALRAITLTPAEILGVAADTGSLAVGKYGDVLVCDRPLFESDSRVLMVLGKGRTEFEAN